MEIIQRIMDKSFDDESMKRSTYIHILDLHEDGHIRPHIDATRVKHFSCYGWILLFF